MELDLSPKVKKSLKYEVVELNMFSDKFDFVHYCQEIGANGDHLRLWELLQYEKQMKIFFFAQFYSAHFEKKWVD